MNKTDLKQIIIDQKAEIDILLKKHIIKRTAVSFSELDMQNDLIKVIMGVRRSGKSVFSHLILKGQLYGYINFDDERLLALKSDGLNDIYQLILEIDPDVKAIIFDEIQNIKGWELFVNRLKRKGLQIIITGSNSNLLSQELATHLTGRHLSYEIFPFSFKEYLAYLNKDHLISSSLTTEQKAQVMNLFDQYIQRGGFPETLDLDPVYLYLRELYDKLITRDIVTRYALKNVGLLKNVALYLVSNFGNRVSYNRINNILEAKSVHTVQNYVDYLEQVYLAFQLKPFSFKVSESIKHPRKTYCIDTGMIHALAPKTTLDSGRLMENIVFLELKRRSKDIFFYPGKKGEIDFIVRNGQKIETLLQVCFDINDPETYKRETKALIAASTELSCDHLVMITRDERKDLKENKKTIHCIPVWQWLLGKG